MFLKVNIELINSNIELQFYKSADIRKLYSDFGINTSNYNSGTINNFKDMDSILNPEVFIMLYLIVCQYYHP